MQINGTVWHEFLSEKKTTEVNKPEPSVESGSSVEKPLSDEVLLEIRKKLLKIEECSNDIFFHLKYEHGRFSLKMKPGYAVVLTGSIINKLGFDVEVKDEDIKLPIMYWLPKLHKKPTKARFIIASKHCSTKPLSKAVSSVFKLIYAQIESFHR